jgi:hypothetical protein
VVWISSHRRVVRLRRPARRAGILYLAGLGARKCPAFEFAFGLEPIVEITAWLLAAFEIEFVGAKSDFLVRHRVRDGNLSRLGLSRGSFGLCASISVWFR